MERTIEFRRHAEECRKLARAARSAQDREALERMASSWDELAMNRERSLRQKA
jgi:hypothetical protein